MEAGLTKRQAMDATERHHLSPTEAEAWRDWAKRLDPAKTNPPAVLVAALKDQRLPPLPRSSAPVSAPNWSTSPTSAPFSTHSVLVPRDDGLPELVPLVDLWQRVQTELQEQLPHNDFETWLKPTALLAIDDEVAIIGAPNVFVRQELEARYLDLFQGALQALLRRPVVAQVVIDAVGR